MIQAENEIQAKELAQAMGLLYGQHPAYWTWFVGTGEELAIMNASPDRNALSADDRQHLETIESEHDAIHQRAIAEFPRQYVDSGLENEARDQVIRECADRLAMAIARRHGLVADYDIAKAMNEVTPADCRVVSQHDHNQLVAHAAALWRIILESSDAQTIERAKALLPECLDDNHPQCLAIEAMRAQVNA